MDFDLKERTVLLTIAGSRAYGMATETSDVDVKGVCIAPRSYRDGFRNKFEQAEGVSQLSVFYDCLNDIEKKCADAGEFEGSVCQLPTGLARRLVTY